MQLSHLQTQLIATNERHDASHAHTAESKDQRPNNNVCIERHILLKGFAQRAFERFMSRGALWPEFSGQVRGMHSDSTGARTYLGDNAPPHVSACKILNLNQSLAAVLLVLEELSLSEVLLDGALLGCAQTLAVALGFALAFDFGRALASSSCPASSSASVSTL